MSQIVAEVRASRKERPAPPLPIADATDVDATLFVAGDAAFAGSDDATDRVTESPMVLLRRALGSPRDALRKLWRLAATLLSILNVPEANRRLRLLQSRGFIQTMPSHKQLIFGGLDMLRYFIKPGAEAYYETKGINPRFHYLLRLLDDPTSMIDPIGIRSSRDTIIGHVLQVVHANPTYDFQLLEMFEDGMEEMQRQTEAMLAKTHPRYRSISAIVEDPEYHARLLDFVRRYRENPRTPQLLRKTGAIRQNPSFVLAEMTYGTLPSFMRYAARLPNTLSGLWRHYREHTTIQPEHCDPAVVAAHREIFRRSPRKKPATLN